MADETTVSEAPATEAPVTEAPAAEGQEAPAAAAAEQKKEEKRVEAALKKYRLKVDGEEVEVDEAELQKGYALNRTAYKRLEEAATLRKQLEGFVSQFKSDPVAVMKQLAKEGPQSKAFREAVEKFLYDEYQREKMDPKERALLEAQEKLKAAEEEKKSWEQKEKEKRIAVAQEHWAKKYDEDITSALSDPAIGIPKTPQTVRRMAQLMAKSLQLGIDADAKDVARIVKEEYLAEHKSVIGGLSGEALIKYLGADVAKRIREYEVSQLKTKPGATSPTPPARVPAKKEEPPKKMTERDFDERLKRIARGEA